eukprot:COSAG06_NODE_11302_length_1531_cov_2.036313_1_plen_147_part_10
MWLLEDVTVEGKSIGSLDGDWGDALCEAAGGDVNIWDFVARVDGEALEAAIKKSGQKARVFKKLFARLHHELRYPLTEAQAKKIKVTPWVVDGLPPGDSETPRGRVRYERRTEGGDEMDGDTSREQRAERNEVNEAPSTYDDWLEAL